MCLVNQERIGIGISQRLRSEMYVVWRASKMGFRGAFLVGGYLLGGVNIDLGCNQGLNLISYRKFHMPLEEIY